MEKVMAMNGFEELNENELLGTEGGIPIPLVLLVAGLALTLTGCGEGSNVTEQRLDQIHDQLGCDQYDECLGEGDCPYH